jgi:hypothetical protein
LWSLDHAAYAGYEEKGKYSMFLRRKRDQRATPPDLDLVALLEPYSVARELQAVGTAGAGASQETETDSDSRI